LLRQDAFKRGKGRRNARQVNGEHVLEVVEKIQRRAVANAYHTATHDHLGPIGRAGGNATYLFARGDGIDI